MSAKVRHAHLWGRREIVEKDARGEARLSGGKYHWLLEHDLSSTPWTKLQPQSPFYLFVPQDVGLRKEYEEGWKVSDAIPVNSVGIVTARDHLTIHWTEEEAWNTVRDFCNLPPEEAREKYNLGKDARDWKVTFAQEDLQASGPREELIVPVLYRPFDTRYTYYTGRSRGFICMPRPEAMRHMISGKNLALIATRQTRDLWDVFITEYVIGHKSLAAYDINSVFPLYLYPQPEKEDLFDAEGASEAPGGRRANLAPEFIEDFSKRLKLKFLPDGQGDLDNTFGPEDVFHYLYAVFHSPTYRQRYAEFLKIDFPRLPLTSRPALFRALCALGERLVALHLMETDLETFTSFPQGGDNTVEHVRYTQAAATPPPPPSPARGEGAHHPPSPGGRGSGGGGTPHPICANKARTDHNPLHPTSSETDPPPPPSPARGEGAHRPPSPGGRGLGGGGNVGRVWINKTQYFNGVPEDVWNFHVGGYQVCHKWLKDRKGRRLAYDDVTHYQRMVAALSETIRLMNEIDQVIDAHGGWPIR